MISKSIKSFLIMTAILGILIGIQIKSPFQISTDGSFIMRDTITKINKERIENFSLLKQKKEYERIIDDLEDEVTKENKDIYKLKNQTNNLKMNLGYIGVSGPGIKIKIETKDDDRNLAYLVEEKKLLLVLVNELKKEEVDAIAINGQRINNFSEITLAGNHININSIAIAPPYELAVIGNSSKLIDYVNDKSPIIDIMKNGYNLDIEFKPEIEIIIKKIDYIKNIEYMRSEL